MKYFPTVQKNSDDSDPIKEFGTEIKRIWNGDKQLEFETEIYPVQTGVGPKKNVTSVS